MDQLQSRLSHVRRFCVPVLVLLIISLCLQISGFASNGWVVFSLNGKYGTTTTHAGLWNVRYCYGDRCISKPIEGKEAIAEVTEFRVETGLALAFIFIAIVAGLPRWLTETRVFVIILTLISGILALVAAGRVANETIKSHHSWTRYSTTDSPFRFPYSVFLTGVGGILACVTSFLICCNERACTGNSVATPVGHRPIEMVGIV